MTSSLQRGGQSSQTSDENRVICNKDSVTGLGLLPYTRKCATQRNVCSFFFFYFSFFFFFFNFFQQPLSVMTSSLRRKGGAEFTNFRRESCRLQQGFCHRTRASPIHLQTGDRTPVVHNGKCCCCLFSFMSLFFFNAVFNLYKGRILDLQRPVVAGVAAGLALPEVVMPHC